MSTVVWNHDKVVLPINEPAQGRRKSQIEEYLDYYGTPGVQHIALHTAGHRGVRSRCRARRFYSWTSRGSTTTRRAAAWTEVEAALQEALPRGSGILVDRDHYGHLLQIFTETLTEPADRSSSRSSSGKGATGFGEGNFKALFESIERAQARRGNL